MSQLHSTPESEANRCSAHPLREAVGRFEARTSIMGGGLKIRRALPLEQKRLIGPWCFLDHFGPLRLEPNQKGMSVGPHPHIGLQTVTWLIEGEVLHRDSLGYQGVIRPGELNVMTAGRGISHSEESPEGRPDTMHGLQMWVALPEAERRREPAFDHYAEVPTVELSGASAHVFAGSFHGATSPATFYSPIVGIDVEVNASGTHELPVDASFEHGLLVTQGALEVNGHRLEIGGLLAFAPGVSALSVTADEGTRYAVVGGAPFGEPIVLWWNFVARTVEEIEAARDQWNAQDPIFGEVHGFDGPSLEPPTLRPIPEPG